MYVPDTLLQLCSELKKISVQTKPETRTRAGIIKLEDKYAKHTSLSIDALVKDLT